MSETRIEHLVVVCGMPGTGKTWLSERLAPAIGYPLLSRDRIKQAMFEALAAEDRVTPLEWSRTLGSAAFTVLLEIAPWLGPRVVLDAHFQRRFGAEGQIRALAASATQIYCHAASDVILRRNLERFNDRHAAHQVYPLPTLADIEAARAFFAPLDLGGPLLKLDTSEVVDVAAVAEWVRRAVRL